MVGLLAAVMLLAVACSSPEATTPTVQLPPLGFPSGTSGPTAVNAATAITGSWQRVDVISPDSSADVITQTTQWTFDGSGGCTRTITTLDAAEGFPRGTTTDCSYTLGSQTITITWADASVNTYSLTFANFDPDRLVLDGLEYQRTT